MRDVEWRIGNAFSVFCVVQLRGDSWRHAWPLVERLQRQFDIGEGNALLTPLVMFGRQDLLLRVTCTNLERGVRVIYDAVDQIDTVTGPIRRLDRVISAHARVLTGVTSRAAH